MSDQRKDAAEYASRVDERLRATLIARRPVGDYDKGGEPFYDPPLSDDDYDFVERDDQLLLIRSSKSTRDVNARLFDLIERTRAEMPDSERSRAREITLRMARFATTNQDTYTFWGNYIFDLTNGILSAELHERKLEMHRH